MSENPAGERGRSVRIHIQGKIDEDWSDWFEGLSVQTTEEGTLLVGEVADQSALYGILARLRDLGLELLSVEQVE